LEKSLRLSSLAGKIGAVTAYATLAEEPVLNHSLVNKEKVAPLCVNRSCLDQNQHRPGRISTPRAEDELICLQLGLGEPLRKTGNGQGPSR
jgi:hypothetical protein